MEFDIVSYLLGASSGGAVTLMPETDWNALTVAEKNQYGLVAVQTAETGVERGYLVDGHSYLENPVLLYSASMNGSSTSPLEYTATADNTVAVLVFAINPLEGKTIENIKISKNSVDITSGFELCVSDTTSHFLGYGIKLDISDGDVFTVENTQTVTNSGVQVYVLTNVEPSNLSLVGVTGNDNSTFNIPQSLSAWYLQAAKFGYYNANNTAPTVTLFQCKDAVGRSTACPNSQTYWYGGTWVIAVQS